MNDKFVDYCEELMEEHLPMGFLDYHFLLQLRTMLEDRTDIGRKEILIFAYIIGATVEEGNELLRLLGHPTLYVKRREDAIWSFALKERLDSKAIIDMIFPQNVDEDSGKR